MRRRRHIDIVEGRIVAKRTLAEADFKPSTYGYWVKPDGEIVPVPWQGHFDALRSYEMDEHEALKAGWIRVVYRGYGVLYAQIQKVIAKAVTALRSIIRYADATGPQSYIIQTWGGSDELTTAAAAQKKLSAILRAHRTVSKEFANRAPVEDEELAEEVIQFPGNNRPVDKVAKAKGGADIYRAVRNPKLESLDLFTRAYINAIMLTTEADEIGVAQVRWEDFSNESTQRIIEDCRSFQAKNARLLKKAYGMGVAYHEEFAGHDFWLTRNRHGTGFWDRGLAAVGKELTVKAHAYGEVNVLGENGVIYVE